MHKEELIYLECENGHTFAIRADENEGVNLEELTCPICNDYVSNEMNRTVLVATGYKDLLAIDKFLKQRDEGES